MDEKQEQKFHQMTETPVSTLICRLALPCIISMLVTSFYNLSLIHISEPTRPY